MGLHMAITHTITQPPPNTHIHTTSSAITQISWSDVTSGPNRPSSVFSVLFHLHLGFPLLRIL